MNELLLRRRLAAMTPVLPYDAKVEYLEGSGTQYIDTGVKVSSSVKFDITMSFASSPGQFFGGRVALGNSQMSIFWSNSESKLEYRFGNKLTNSFMSFVIDTIYRFANLGSVNSCNIYYGNSTKTITVTNNTFTSNNNFYLVKTNQNGTAGGNLSNYRPRLYSAKLYVSSVLVFDGIPVRVGQVGYLYDKVSGQLFGNAGTGDFTLGNDITT